MMRLIRWGVAGSALAVASAVLLTVASQGTAADDKDAAGTLPEAEYAKLVERGIHHVLDGLKGVQTGEKKYAARFQRQARAGAAMIAAYAQNGPSSKSAAQRATLRDAALQLLTTLKADKWEAAKKQAEALKDLKENPSADVKPVPLMPGRIELLDVMQQFSSLPGGLGIERDRILDVLANREVKKTRTLTDKVLTEDFVLSAYQMAVIADVIKDHQPQKVKGGGDKEWRGFTADMRQSALELAGTAQKKDGKAALAALMKLNSSCRNCHEVFRPME